MKSASQVLPQGQVDRRAECIPVVPGPPVVNQAQVLDRALAGHAGLHQQEGDLNRKLPSWRQRPFGFF